MASPLSVCWSVHLSVCPFEVFLKNRLLDFSEFSDFLNFCMKIGFFIIAKKWQTRIFWEILIFPYLSKKGPRWTKNRVFLVFQRKLSLLFTANAL